jgi:hypothetical protein
VLTHSFRLCYYQTASMQAERTFPLRAAAKHSCLLYPSDCLHVPNLLTTNTNTNAQQAVASAWPFLLLSPSPTFALYTKADDRSAILL